MHKFYTHVFTDKGRVKVRGWQNGRRFQETVQYKPYLFIQSDKSDTPYRTLKGNPVERLDFDSIYEAREFHKKYKEVDNFEIFGSTSWEYMYLYDNFKDMNFDISQVSVVNVDIEVNADEFPRADQANWPISAITLEKNNKVITLGCNDYETDQSNVLYIKCKDEKELLEKFVTIWMNLDPDIVTGWNIDHFDIPYLVNRIRKLLGEDWVVMLSPWKKIQSHTVFHHGKDETIYELVGITSLDYLPVYKKFSFGNEESYSLNYIASVVVGEKKIDYSEYESLLDLYHKDYKKFIDYNIKDVLLVRRINDKLQFIQQIITIAYSSLVNFSDTFTSVKIWEIIMHNYLMDKKIVIPRKTKSRKEKRIAGGHVKEPYTGKHEWVLSFDLDSLYPHLIMQYNISPETFYDTLDTLESEEESVDKILNGFMTDEKTQQLKDANLSLTAGGALYTNTIRGFVAELMDIMYNDRKAFKKKMLAAKQELEAVEAELKKRGISK